MVHVTMKANVKLEALCWRHEAGMYKTNRGAEYLIMPGWWIISFPNGTSMVVPPDEFADTFDVEVSSHA